MFLKHTSNAYIYKDIKKKISENENYIYHNETEENKIKHMLSSGLNNLNFKIIAKKELNQFTTLIQVDI